MQASLNSYPNSNIFIRYFKTQLHSQHVLFFLDITALIILGCFSPANKSRSQDTSALCLLVITNLSITKSISLWRVYDQSGLFLLVCTAFGFHRCLKKNRLASISNTGDNGLKTYPCRRLAAPLLQKRKCHCSIPENC